MHSRLCPAIRLQGEGQQSNPPAIFIPSCGHLMLPRYPQLNGGDCRAGRIDPSPAMHSRCWPDCKGLGGEKGIGSKVIQQALSQVYFPDEQDLMLVSQAGGQHAALPRLSSMYIFACV